MFVNHIKELCSYSNIALLVHLNANKINTRFIIFLLIIIIIFNLKIICAAYIKSYQLYTHACILFPSDFFFSSDKFNLLKFNQENFNVK